MKKSIDKIDNELEIVTLEPYPDEEFQNLTIEQRLELLFDLGVIAGVAYMNYGDKSVIEIKNNALALKNFNKIMEIFYKNQNRGEIAK